MGRPSAGDGMLRRLTSKQRPRPWGIRCQSAAGGRIWSGSGRRGGAGRECSGRSPGRRPFPCPRAAEGRRLLAPGPAPPPGPASTASRACGCRCAVNKASLPGRPLATEEGFPGRVPPRMWAAAAEGSGPCGLLLPVPRPASPKLALRVPSREGLSRKSRVQDETDSTFPRQHWLKRRPIRRLLGCLRAATTLPLKSAPPSPS